MSLVDMAAAFAPTWWVGTTLLLGIGALVVGRAREPAERQRWGELAVGVTIAWLVLALMPLPRVDLGAWIPAEATAPAAERTVVTAPPLRERAAVSRDVAPAAAPRVEVRSHPLEETPRRPTRSAATTPVHTSVPAPTTAWSMLRGVGVALLVGVGLGVALLLLGLLRLAHLLRARTATPLSLRRVARRLGGPPWRWLVVTSARCRPFCVGVRRPVVVVPERLCLAASDEVLEAMLRHELAHVARRDGVGQALLALATPLLCLHPLFWWLRRRVRLSAELLADDLAAGDSRPRYARRLLRLSELDVASFPRPAGALPVFESKSQLTRRIEMLVRRPHRLVTSAPRPRRLVQLGLSALLLATTASFLGASPATGDEEKREIARLRAQVADLRAVLETMRADHDALLKELQNVRSQQKGGAAGRMTARMTEEEIEPIEPIEPIEEMEEIEEVEPEELVEDPLLVANDVIGIGGGRGGARGASPFGGGGDGVVSETSARLMMQLIELDGAMKIAEVRVATAQRQFDAGVGGKEAALEAAVELETLERRRALGHRLLSAEFEAAVAELERREANLARSRKLAESGFISANEIQEEEAALRRAKTRVVLLQEYL